MTNTSNHNRQNHPSTEDDFLSTLLPGYVEKTQETIALVLEIIQILEEGPFEEKHQLIAQQLYWVMLNSFQFAIDLDLDEQIRSLFERPLWELHSLISKR
ncbi:MAG: hypothetical protein KDE51_07030 [Anaerolineales bacterium]|nr:hypothetical protein [Anaerolineales bacterium]